MNTQTAKMSQNAPFAPFFRKISRRDPPCPHPNCKGIFPNEPTPPHRFEVGLQPTPEVDIVSGSVTDNAMYIFNAILLKIQLSLGEFKRLYLHPRLHHFASFFQNFLGGGPPNPHQREGTPLPSLPTRPFGPQETPPPSSVLDPPLVSPIHSTSLEMSEVSSAT